MVKKTDFDIISHWKDEEQPEWAFFEFRGCYDLFADKPEEGEAVYLYLDVQPFTNEVIVETEHIDKDGYVEQCASYLNGDMKKVFRQAAEGYIQDTEGVYLEEYCFTPNG